MGLFSNKEEEEKNEFGFIGASEWMNEQAKTAKAFNEEDDKMAGQNKPKQARLFIAIEDNGKTDSVAMAIKTNDPRLLTRALYKIDRRTRHSPSSSSWQQQSSVSWRNWSMTMR